MPSLSSKVAIVTGGASGLGKAVGRRLRADGAHVVITDVQAEMGIATAKADDFIFLEQDVCNESRWTEIVRDVEERFGHLDILVNNAGILGSPDAFSPEDSALLDWRRVFAINVEGVFLGCRAAIPAMRRAAGGSIINLSSVAGLLATPYATAYGASKAAVRQLTKSVAQYCAEQKLPVRCNSLHPGMVRTPLWNQQADDIARRQGVSIDEIIAEKQAVIPMGDFTLPEDIAAAAAFLASDDSRHITGSKIIVDGGIVHCDTYHMTGQSASTSRGR